MSERFTGRFSPSPTGKLHLGSLRTALISFITSDKFVLRIEDTDKQRSTKESEQEIIDTFKWLEIPIEGEVVRQSEQQASGMYGDIAEALVASGYAYYCNCSVDELKAMKTQQIKNKERRLGYIGKCREAGNTTGVIRLNARKIGEERMDGKFFVFQDDVYNTRRVDFRDVPDAILMRSDGSATYILANTIDDMQAEVNYIARGADIITQTATQMALREAIHWATGMPLPDVHYAHLPLILGSQKEKLSKRNPNTKAILEYKDQGFLKEAIVQFVLSLGNNSIPTNKAMSIEEIKASYNVKALRRNDTAFLEHKLRHLNSLHMKKLSSEDAKTMVEDIYGMSYDISIISAFKDRVQTLQDLSDKCNQFLQLTAPHAQEIEDLRKAKFSARACQHFRDSILEGMRTPPLNELLK